jgi:hypothetical protein
MQKLLTLTFLTTTFLSNALDINEKQDTTTQEQFKSLTSNATQPDNQPTASITGDDIRQLVIEQFEHNADRFKNGLLTDEEKQLFAQEAEGIMACVQNCSSDCNDTLKIFAEIIAGLPNTATTEKVQAVLKAMEAKQASL